MSESFNEERCHGMLTAEETAKATSELNEPQDDEERLHRIDNLRNAFVKENKKLKLCRRDDSFFLRFLRARKFHQHAALQVLTNYHIQKESWPEVFDKVKNPVLVKKAFESGCCVVLEGQAKDGSIVLISRPGKFKSTIDWIAALVITYEHLLEQEIVQINGVTSIDDFTYIGFEFIRQLWGILKHMGALFEDSMPIRIKSINVVNEPAWSDAFYAIVRPFLKEKIRKRLTVHGKTFSRLHEIIDASVLPPLFGGTGKSIELMTDWWRHEIYHDDF